MKLITAVVQPNRINEIVVALEDIDNFPGVTVSDAAGFASKEKITFDDVLDPLKAKKRVEIVAADNIVESITDAIRRCAHTGRKGDGIIWLTSIEKSIAI